MELKPLTELASCAGCAAKLANEDLRGILSQLPTPIDDRLLVGGGPDDAGVYRISSQMVAIQSVDFFTPIVDVPFDYGAIAATNAISDIYAMGAKPATALNIVGVPMQEVGPDRLKEILNGGCSVAEKAGMALLGGHTIKSQEPIYGMAVTGFAGHDEWIKNGQCQPGDALILTKPLGTGIKTTSYMGGAIGNSELKEAVDWMTTLNDVGVDLCRGQLINGMTDVTGFGLFQHLRELLGEDFGAEIYYSRVPFMEGVSSLAADGFIPGGTKSNWKAMRSQVKVKISNELAPLLLSDAQTSGGLLLSVNPNRTQEVKDILAPRGLCSKQIGTVTAESPLLICE
jgi:selenide,water dikinase